MPVNNVTNRRTPVCCGAVSSRATRCRSGLSQRYKTPRAGGAQHGAMDAASTLRRMVFGFRMTQLVSVVAQLGVADRLRGGARSAEALAAEVGAEAQALRR